VRQLEVGQSSAHLTEDTVITAEVKNSLTGLRASSAAIAVIIAFRSGLLNMLGYLSVR